MTDQAKMDESALFDIATMGKSHKQKIRCQIICSYLSRFKPPSGEIPKHWEDDINTMYVWVMKDE